MNEMIGFVLGDRHRERVIKVLSSRGSLSLEKISKIERVPLHGIDRILRELKDKGLVAEAQESWSLTPEGEEVDKEIRRRG